MGTKKRLPGQGLSVDAFFKIVHGIESARDKLILLILFETGCSVGELCGIRASDYNAPDDITQNNSISFESPKRESIISTGLASALSSFILLRKRKGTEYLFSQKPQKPLSVKRVEQVIALISAASRIDFSPQDIRYLHICHAARIGLAPDAIASHAGISRQRVLQVLDAAGITYSQSYSLFFEDLKLRRDQP